MIGGPGISISYPAATWPATFGGNNISGGLGSNYLDLPAGGVVMVPPGKFYVFPGKYSFLQFFDPIMQIWVNDQSAGSVGRIITSDGASWRVFNALGTPVGALMTASGTTYAAGATAATASTGGSAWRPIVGGAMSQTVTITSGGTKYTYRPTLVIDAPPVGGVPASAVCTISAGAINAVTVVNQGAGYKVAPRVMVYPHPLDPNFSSITPAVLTAALASGGDATGVAALLCTAPGTVLTTAPTLTLTGGDGNATAVAIMALTVTGVSFSASGGVAYPGSNVSVPTLAGMVTSAASSILNPRISTGLFTPRPGVIYAPVASGAVGTAVLIDGGVFQIAPSANVIATAVASGALPTTATVASLTMGSANDRVLLQAV